MDIAVAGAGSWVKLSADGSKIDAARVSVCAVAPTPKFAADASAWLAGKPATVRFIRPGRRTGQESRQPDHRHARHDRIPHASCRRPRETHARQGRRASDNVGNALRGVPRPLLTNSPLTPLSVSKKTHVTATINSESTEFLCEPRQSLLEVLRDVLKLTGAKEGCNNGNCGACTVIMNGVPVNSCLVLASRPTGLRSRRSRGSPAKGTCILYSNASWKGRPSNAASARRAFSSLPKPCSTKTRIPANTKFASTSPTTSAAAPATTRSSARCKPQRRNLLRRSEP